MKLLTDSANVPDEVIIRNLSDGPDYRPDWRFRTVQKYLLQARSTDSFQDSIDAILEQEPDQLVRQLLLFHADRRSEIADRIEYALRCVRNEAETRIAAFIKAMIIAGRSSQQIAKTIGTNSKNISAFEKIFFDVRRYRDNRTWINAICSPRLDRTAPASRHWEKRLMSIAFNRGWPGLHDFFRKPSSKIGHLDWDRLIRGLVARAADFVNELEMEGIPPSDRDLQMLVAAVRAMKSPGIATSFGDLAYPDPEQEAKLQGIQKLASAYPVGTRRRLAEAFRIIRFALERQAKQKSDQSSA